MIYLTTILGNHPDIRTEEVRNLYFSTDRMMRFFEPGYEYSLFKEKIERGSKVTKVVILDLSSDYNNITRQFVELIEMLHEDNLLMLDVIFISEDKINIKPFIFLIGSLKDDSCTYFNLDEFTPERKYNFWNKIATVKHKWR